MELLLLQTRPSTLKARKRDWPTANSTRQEREREREKERKKERAGIISWIKLLLTAAFTRHAFFRSPEHGQARREGHHDLRVVLLPRFPGRDAGLLLGDFMLLSVLTDLSSSAMPDERAVMTCVSSYYHTFSGAQKASSETTTVWGKAG